MAVTVNTAQKPKQSKTASSAPPVDLSDYAVSTEKSEGTRMLLIWVLSIIAACAVLAIIPGGVTQPFAIGIFAWWLLASIGYLFIAPRLVLRRLRSHGSEYVISSKKSPRLKTMLSKGSALIGIGEPEGYLVPDTVSQVRVAGPPPFLLVSQGACDTLSAAEIDCLALRSLIHIRQGHARRIAMLKFLQDTPPAARILVWPIGFYGALLRVAWSELADQTADRLTLLLVKNHKLVLSSILKQHTATDPLMQDADVTVEDIDAYVRQSGSIGLKGSEISTQYKIGSAISNNPYLRARLEALSGFARSSEYAEAVEKLTNARTGATPAAPSDPISSTTPTPSSSK